MFHRLIERERTRISKMYVVTTTFSLYTEGRGREEDVHSSSVSLVSLSRRNIKIIIKKKIRNDSHCLRLHFK